MASTGTASLYVGDLDRDVTEAILFDIFRNIGPVLSIRVCRDAATRKSLGYAYVNFQSPLDAEKALEQMNHTKINGKMCRIMWCKRDPSLRKSGQGNVFIKNLETSIDNKTLFDTFRQFGEILSCKVVVDEKSASKGYGFVHFQDEKSANKAVEEVNGMLMNDQQVYVGKFERKDKKLQNLSETFTNIYFKHFDANAEEQAIRSFFEKFGPIQSFFLQPSDTAGAKQGVGFINYTRHEDALRACEEANDTEPEDLTQPGKKIRVVRHQKKTERDFNKKQLIKEKQQQLLKYTNLYVKNLDDSVTSESLREAFNEFGVIISCKVMTHTDSNVSKGFGFVCFQEGDAARKAMTQMNGRMLAGKPLYVTLAQKKDARKEYLEMMYTGGGRGMMNNNNNPGPGVMGQGFMSGQVPVGFGGQPQPGFGGGYGNMPPRSGGFGGGLPQMVGRQPMPGMPGGPQPMNRPGFPPLQRGGQMPGPMPGPMSRNQQNRPMMPPMPQMGRSGMGGMGGMPGQAGFGQGGAGGAGGGSSGIEVDPARLASLNEEERKNYLGERLFELIRKVEGQHAAKITGMLLEMDNSEILNLLDSPNLLHQKITEAMSVLRQYHRDM